MDELLRAYTYLDCSICESLRPWHVKQIVQVRE